MFLIRMHDDDERWMLNSVEFSRDDAGADYGWTRYWKELYLAFLIRDALRAVLVLSMFCFLGVECISNRRDDVFLLTYATLTRLLLFRTLFASPREMLSAW